MIVYRDAVAKKLGTWDGGAVRPAELSQAQAHGPSEAELGVAK
jgi:hypothetical protein